MNRAYSILTVKTVEEDQRVIRGTATTPSPDRVGDILEPFGAEFAAEIPALWQHNHHEPVGHVTLGKPSSKGIPFTIRMARTDEPGTLKDRLDEAWQSVKLRLVKAVSVGFRAIEYALLESGGIRFLKFEILELSLVTIPANADCTISSIKSIDTEIRAATGIKDGEGRPVPPGVTGTPKVKAITTPKEGTKMKTIAEQISAFEATRLSKAADLETLMTGSEGETLDADNADAADTLTAEIKSIDDHLKRLRIVEGLKASTATPVRTVADVAQPVVVKQKAKLEPGIRFARYAKCLALSTKMHLPLNQVAEGMYGKADPEFVDMTKAAVAAMTTGNTSALIGNEGGFADFVEFLRPMTILGKFGTGGIPALSRIPFRIPIIGETAEADAQWVGEGKGKPLTKTTYDRTELAPLKVAALAVQTMELIRDSSPSSDILIRNALAKAIVKRLDLSFINPAFAAVAGVNPGSILNGVAAITASAETDADGVRADAQAIMAAFVTANNPLTSGVWIISGISALKIMGFLNPLGQREFPGVTINGGTFFDLPVIVSNYVGDYMALVNAEDIHVADEDGIDIAMSTEASLEMSDAPTQDAGAATPVATEVVSMFQTNSVAFRAERTINWRRRRASAVAWVNTLAWN